MEIRLKQFKTLERGERVAALNAIQSAYQACADAYHWDPFSAAPSNAERYRKIALKPLATRSPLTS